MANWGGIVAGAIGGLGEAAQGMAQGYIEDERRTTVAQQLSDIEEKRQGRIAAAAQTMRRDDDQYAFDQGVARAPTLAKLEADKTRTVGGAKNDVEIEGETRMGPVKATNEGLVGNAKAKVKRQEMIDYANDPLARRGNRAEATDRHITGVGEAAAAEASRMTTTEKKERMAAVKALTAIEDDTSLAPAEKTAKIASAQRAIDNIDRRSRGSASDINGAAANARNLITLADKAEAEGDVEGAKRLRTDAAEASRGAINKKLPGVVASAAPGRVATMSEVEQFAKARGLKTEDARRNLEAQGYKIQ